MSEVESGLSAGAQPPTLTKEQVIAIANDRELRALKPGSDAYKAAIEKKFSNRSTESSASATESDGADAETKSDVSETKTETSSDKGSEKTGSKSEKRFAKLVAERETIRAENARLAAELAELKKAKTTEAPKSQETAPTSTTEFTKPKPKVEDFKLVSEYVEALSDWKAEKRDFEKEQSARIKTAQEQMRSRFDKFFETGKQIEKELGLEEGYFDVVVKDKDFKISDAARDYTLENESGFGPQVAFEIANNEELRDKFNKMNPVQQIAFIGKLEAKLEAQKQETKETKTISTAKAPGKTLAKGSASSTQGFRFVKGMSTKDYEAQRIAERRAKGFRR